MSKRHVIVTVAIRDGDLDGDSIKNITLHSVQSIKMQFEITDPPTKVMDACSNAAEEVARRILQVPTPEKKGGRS